MKKSHTILLSLNLATGEFFLLDGPVENANELEIVKDSLRRIVGLGFAMSMDDLKKWITNYKFENHDKLWRQGKEKASIILRRLNRTAEEVEPNGN